MHVYFEEFYLIFYFCILLISNIYRPIFRIIHRSYILGSTYFFPVVTKEGNVLFNNALNTFTYGYMVSDIW